MSVLADDASPSSIVWTGILMDQNLLASMDSIVSSNAGDCIRELMQKDPCAGWTTHGSLLSGYKGLRLDVYQAVDDPSASYTVWSYACVFRQTFRFRRNQAQLVLSHIAAVTENFRKSGMATDKEVSTVLESILSDQMKKSESTSGLGDTDYAELMIARNKEILEDSVQHEALTEKELRSYEFITENGLDSNAPTGVDLSFTSEEEDENSLHIRSPERCKLSGSTTPSPSRTISSESTTLSFQLDIDDSDDDTIVTLGNDLAVSDHSGSLVNLEESEELNHQSDIPGDCQLSDAQTSYERFSFPDDMISGLRANVDADVKTDDESGPDGNYCFPCRFLQGRKSPLIELN